MSDRNPEDRDDARKTGRRESGKLVDQDGPRKEHGDALRTGTGSRQGDAGGARAPRPER